VPTPPGNQAKPVLLVVDRSGDGSGIWAMVWTAETEDPEMLESRKFKGDAAFKVWLSGMAARHGRANIRVSWTEALVADERLLGALEGVIAAVPPPSLGPKA